MLCFFTCSSHSFTPEHHLHLSFALPWVPNHHPCPDPAWIPGVLCQYLCGHQGYHLVERYLWVVPLGLLEMRCVGHRCVSSSCRWSSGPSLTTSFLHSSKMLEVENAFRKFALYGDRSASGNNMTGKNFSKMCRECGVMDGQAVTSTDIDIISHKVK